MWTVPVLCGLTSAAALWLGIRSEARGAGLLAAMLVALWALANAAWVSDSLWLLPAFDLGVGIVTLNVWWTTQAKWVALIANAVAIRLVLHVLDCSTGHLFLVSYIHALNATFVWMLAVVASSGSDDVRNRLLRSIRRIRGALSSAPQRRLTNGR